MNPSRPVRTNQDGIHPRLDETVRRHLATTWKQPLRRHSRSVFERLVAGLGPDRPLVVDSGCGTGASAICLALEHPDCLVIGVDRSASRLARVPAELPANVRLVRAELADFWRLAARAGWRLHRHFLLYPNPWPKAEHLKRRWHAHPVLPDLVALGGRLEVRSNWKIYVDEFARALALAGIRRIQVVSLQVERILTPFERKYAASGHPLFRLTAELEAQQ